MCVCVCFLGQASLRTLLFVHHGHIYEAWAIKPTLSKNYGLVFDDILDRLDIINILSKSETYTEIIRGHSIGSKYGMS